MPVATAFAVTTASVVPALIGTPLQGFIPFLTDQMTLAGVGLGAFSRSHGSFSRTTIWTT